MALSLPFPLNVDQIAAGREREATVAISSERQEVGRGKNTKERGRKEAAILFSSALLYPYYVQCSSGMECLSQEEAEKKLRRTADGAYYSTHGNSYAYIHHTT